MFARFSACWLIVLGVALLGPAAARAANEGQADLDKATEAKLSAESLDDLSEVVRLCHRALEAGLDKQNSSFAADMLAGTLTQRAEIISAEIFERPQVPPRWPELRRMALSDLEESVKLHPNQPDAQYMIGRLHALPGGDRKRALSALDDAVEQSESEPQVRVKALLIRAQLTPDEEQRAADYELAAKLAPHNAEALRARGLHYLSKNQFEDGIADLDAALAIDPKNADTYEAKGVGLFLQKKFDEALEAFDKASELAPDSPVAYTHRARIFAIQNQTDKALAEVEKAMQLEPRSPAMLLLRARIYQQAGKSDQALDDVDEVLRLRPGAGEALQLHAVLAAGAGKFDQAISDLEELKALAPNNTELLLQLGLFYTADKQPQKAIDMFDKVLSSDAKNWLAFRGRADANLNIGKQNAARTDYEAALELDPKNSGVLNNLAWLLATSPDDKLRDGKRAVELATEACKLTDFKQAHILSTLAAGYAEIGDFQNAMVWSRKAVAAGKPQIKEQLGKELQSYEQKKPWREALPPEGIVVDENDSTSDGDAMDAEDMPAAEDDGNAPADPLAPSGSADGDSLEAGGSADGDSIDSTRDE